MSMRTILLAGSILALPAVAIAQPITGLYVGAGAGANFLQNEVVRHLQLDGSGLRDHGASTRFDAGYAGIGSIGYGFGNGLRIELEGNYRANDLKRGQRGLGAASNGQEQKYGAMVNALYDVDLKPYGIDYMMPYFGVGAGYANQRYNHVEILNGNTRLHINNGVDQIAFQGIAGVAFPLPTLAPGLALTVDYRFYDTPQDAKYKVQYDNYATGTTTGGKLKVGNDLNHTVMVGVRYAFNTAPPPPPPAPVQVSAPAAAAARTYLVFFDWDRADLTARARQIVADAAQNSSRVTYTRIEVNGYTDTSGTPQYNQGLSVRRAQAVAGELVRDGVSQNAINIQGFGETHPLVPTASGVREPQNRRVEIIIR